MRPPHLHHSNCYSRQALDVLKAKGFRLTKPRKLVLELLESTQEPLNAYDIHRRLQEQQASGDQTSVDIVSVYRILQCLEDNHLIHRLSDQARVMRCNFSDTSCQTKGSQHQHHLLVCKNCGSTQEIHTHHELDELIAFLATQHQFRLGQFPLVFNGQCHACQ